jgi:hypothetical protein
LALEKINRIYDNPFMSLLSHNAGMSLSKEEIRSSQEKYIDRRTYQTTELNFLIKPRDQLEEMKGEIEKKDSMVKKIDIDSSALKII